MPSVFADIVLHSMKSVYVDTEEYAEFLKSLSSDATTAPAATKSNIETEGNNCTTYIGLLLD